MDDPKKYGETNLEIDLKEQQLSREIVREIMNYGVNENSILQIIKLLSLELEDSELGRKITKTIDNNKTVEFAKLYGLNQSTIITDFDEDGI